MERTTASALVRLANYYAWRKNFKNAIKYIKETLGICKARGYKQELAAAYRSLATAYGLSGKTLESTIYFNKALKVLEVVGDKDLIGQTLFEQAEVRKEVGEVEKAKFLFGRALRIFEEFGRKDFVDRIKREFEPKH